MQLIFSPVRCDAALSVARQGDTLILNGEAFDFSELPEGALLPMEAIASDWIAGPVERIDGELKIALALPHGARAPDETRYPAPLAVAADGPVDLPPFETE